MKKIFYILSICVMTILQPSCDALDLAPEDYYGAGNFWKEASQPKAIMLPLIKSQMLYRLSYERIFCGKTIPPNNITTIGCKMQEQCSKKPKFQAYAQKLYSKRLCARRCSSSTSRPV